MLNLLQIPGLRGSGAPRAALMLLAALTFATGIPARAQMATGQKKFAGNVIRDGSNVRSDFPTLWNQVTCENAGKWGDVQSDTATFNWTNLDNIYNYAIAHSFPYKHHTLVWGAQQPAFMAGLDSARQYEEIVDWFYQSGLRYLSATYVDVVNEPLHQPPVYANALGGNGATGWDWVIRSFELAREHWPYRKLHLNDYGIINDNNATTQYLNIIDLLQDRGLIDGIGVQGHRFEMEDAAPATLRSNLDRLAATGLPIFITEFDLGNLDNSGTPNDSMQLALYQQRFPVIWEHPGVRGITFWGYSEGLTWQSTAFLVRSNGTHRPALDWLELYLKKPLPPAIVSPSGTTGEPRNPLLVWNTSPLAASYRAQVATNPGFLTIVVDTVVTDTAHRTIPLDPDTTYYWRVSASNLYGVSSWSAAGEFSTIDQIVDVDEGEELPGAFSLSQNYPNPFNPSTTIEFSLPAGAPVRILLTDLLGRTVRVLADGWYEAGAHAVVLDDPNLVSGVYFCRITAGEHAAVRKLLLAK